MKKSPYCFQYAAKFICMSDFHGSPNTPSGLLDGLYRTSVNIHNPHEHAFEYRMKVARPEGISDWVGDELRPDGVRRITCEDLERFETDPHYFEGYLVIESPCSLDVTGVYTVGNKEHVMSIDVEDVRERILCA